MKKFTFLLVAGMFLSTERNATAQMQTFNTTGVGDSGTIQNFTVPCGVHLITVEAMGAQGGASGGKGAQVQGTFTVVPGEVLNILVGQQGCSNDASHGSGGGGSFVVRASDDTILVIAGGGGGHGASGIDATSDGWLSRNGQSGAGSGTASSGGGGGAAANGTSGGVGCNPGSSSVSSDWAGGGGGFCGDGGVYDGGAKKGGYSFLHGGWGSPAGPTGADCAGGYGGGSGAGDRGAGGGGYSGGAGGTSNTIGGGGGGSYNAGTSQSGTPGFQSGDGQVIISWTVPTGPVVTTSVLTSPLCNGGTGGSARAVATGGSGKYTYSWAPSGGAKDTASALTAGTYTVTVNDSCGNSTTATATITQPAVLTLNGFATDTLICKGACTDVNATAGGGTPSYTYAWNTGATTTSVNVCPLAKTTYTVTLNDANGCALTASVTVDVKVCAGINEVSALDDMIKFYPNPFTQSVNVDIGVSGPVTVTIFNMVGQNAGVYTMDRGLNTINTANLAPGIYTMQVKTESGILNKKLVKME